MRWYLIPLGASPQSIDYQVGRDRCRFGSWRAGISDSRESGGLSGVSLRMVSGTGRLGKWMDRAGLSGQVHCIAPDASALTRATQRYQCGAGTGSATTALGRSTAIPIAVTQ